MIQVTQAFGIELSVTLLRETRKDPALEGRPPVTFFESESGANLTRKLKENRVPAQEFVVKDSLGPVEFSGEIIAEVKHRNGDPGMPVRRRWTDMTLYRVLEPRSKSRYAIHVVGRSVTYHSADTLCRQARNSHWTKITVKELEHSDPDRYEALLPCLDRVCRPGDLDDLDDDAVIWTESDDHKLLTATSAKNIIRAFYGEFGKVNAIATTLLEDAARVNSQIREALEMPRRIS